MNSLRRSRGLWVLGGSVLQCVLVRTGGCSLPYPISLLTDPRVCCPQISLWPASPAILLSLSAPVLAFKLQMPSRAFYTRAGPAVLFTRVLGIHA